LNAKITNSSKAKLRNEKKGHLAHLEVLGYNHLFYTLSVKKRQLHFKGTTTMPSAFIMSFAIGLNEEWTNKELKKKKPFNFNTALYLPGLLEEKTRSV